MSQYPFESAEVKPVMEQHRIAEGVKVPIPDVYEYDLETEPGKAYLINNVLNHICCHKVSFVHLWLDNYSYFCGNIFIIIFRPINKNEEIIICNLLHRFLSGSLGAAAQKNLQPRMF